MLFNPLYIDTAKKQTNATKLPSEVTELIEYMCRLYSRD